MLQSYIYINHVKKQNPSLQITKNQNTRNSKGSKIQLSTLTDLIYQEMHHGKVHLQNQN